MGNGDPFMPLPPEKLITGIPSKSHWYPIYHSVSCMNCFRPLRANSFNRKNLQTLSCSGAGVVSRAVDCVFLQFEVIMEKRCIFTEQCLYSVYYGTIMHAARSLCAIQLMVLWANSFDVKKILVQGICLGTYLLPTGFWGSFSHSSLVNTLSVLIFFNRKLKDLIMTCFIKKSIQVYSGSISILLKYYIPSLRSLF